MREMPPTAGLPLQWRDFLPTRCEPLHEHLGRLLGIDGVQITCSGTAALVIALTTLSSASRRTEVIVPAYTCPLVARAVSHCGLRLRVCDLQEGSLEMDAGQLEDLCSSETLAVIPTFIGGRIHEIGPLLDCAQRAGSAVIEDAAQCMGARHADGTPAGMRGDVGFYSMAVGKGLTMYEGGALVSRHPKMRVGLQLAADRLCGEAFWWELRRSVELLGYALLYNPTALHVAYGRPLRRSLARDDEVSAAGDAMPATLPLHKVRGWRQAVASRAATRWVTFRNDLSSQANRRAARLEALGLDVVTDAPGAVGTWPTVMVLMPDARSRQRVLREFWGAGVGVGVPFARALPDYECVRAIVPAAAVPRGRDMASRLVSISNSPWLDETTFERIVAAMALV